jgi:hypothetical protein
MLQKVIIIMSRTTKYNHIILLVTLLLCIAEPAFAPDSLIRERSSPAPEKTGIVIAAVGDIMMPISIQRAVAGNRYNYDLLFEKIAPDLLSADLTFANLETTVDHESARSGYPRFNAHPELLTALHMAGIRVVSLANNHAMDAGTQGLRRTLDNIGRAGILVTGAGRTREEAEEPTYTAIRDVRVAFLAYTYATNRGMLKRNGNAPSVNILRTDAEDDLARATAAVRKARSSADLVVVSLHWSDEYRTVPTRWQRRAAAELIEAGADVILGHHPHVLQPIESFTARNGRQGLIAFSLGNFISSQNWGVSNKNRNDAKALRGDGIILNVFVKKENGKATVQRAEFVPLWTLREWVGKTVLSRPVNIARETARIEEHGKNTKEEKNILTLLNFRKKVITDQLIAKPAQ